jgi:ssDNA thymidine ADP-ribosyltransferase, DarT
VSGISQENAYIFRITHIKNVPWILSNGIHCRNSRISDPHFHEIGNPDLIDKRARRQVPISPGGTLSDYVPFYFTHYSPMLFNIKTGFNGMQKTSMEEIVIFVSTLHRMKELGQKFLFTDQHAYPVSARYFDELKKLDQIDWKIIETRNFSRDPDDPGKIERYMAEALIYQHVPLSALKGMVCYSVAAQTKVLAMQAKAEVNLKLAIKPDWYF